MASFHFSIIILNRYKDGLLPSLKLDLGLHRDPKIVIFEGECTKSTFSRLSLLTISKADFGFLEASK